MDIEYLRAEAIKYRQQVDDMNKLFNKSIDIAVKAHCNDSKKIKNYTKVIDKVIDTNSTFTELWRIEHEKNQASTKLINEVNKSMNDMKNANNRAKDVKNCYTFDDAFTMIQNAMKQWFNIYSFWNTQDKQVTNNCL